MIFLLGLVSLFEHHNYFLNIILSFNRYSQNRLNNISLVLVFTCCTQVGSGNKKGRAEQPIR